MKTDFITTETKIRPLVICSCSNSSNDPPTGNMGGMSFSIASISLISRCSVSIMWFSPCHGYLSWKISKAFWCSYEAGVQTNEGRYHEHPDTWHIYWIVGRITSSRRPRPPPLSDKKECIAPLALFLQVLSQFSLNEVDMTFLPAIFPLGVSSARLLCKMQSTARRLCML